MTKHETQTELRAVKALDPEFTDEFNWDDLAENVVQPQVERVAIYSNQDGNIVVREEQRWDEERDQFIVIARDHALRAAQAILEAAGLGDVCFYRRTEGGLYEDVQVEPTVGDAPEIGSKDRTAAERQRRRRARQRDKRDGTNRDDRDSDRDTVTELPLLGAAE